MNLISYRPLTGSYAIFGAASEMKAVANTIYYTNRVKIVYNFTINRLYNLLLYIIDKTTVRYTYIWSCRLAHINQPCRDIKFSI